MYIFQFTYKLKERVRQRDSPQTLFNIAKW